MKNTFYDTYTSKKLISELYILRKLSAIKENVFVTKIYDIIVPQALEKDNTAIDSLFVVMEYVDFDLRKMLIKLEEQPDEFTEEHICIILYNMLCCLNFIHSAGLMHRDIKTDNILVNGSCVTKLCDFGLARPCNVNDI